MPLTGGAGPPAPPVVRPPQQTKYEEDPVLSRIADRDRGASLIEVVIACVLLGILSTAVLTIVLQTQAAGVQNRNRVAASNLAAREIDLVRADFGRSDDRPMAIAAQGTVVNQNPLKTTDVVGQPLVVDGVPYTVRRSSQWNVTGNGESACDGGALVNYPTLAVTVTVTWPNMGSVQPVVSSASLAPPKDAGIDTGDSFVAVRVRDSQGQPNAGRGISVVGGGATKTGTTDAEGCAVVQVSPATGGGTMYSATVTDSGYVDISSGANPSKSVGVVKTGQLNNNVTFQVDRAVTVNLRLVDETGAPLADADAAGATLTLVAAETSAASNETPVTATGGTTTVGGLWPTGYGAYFGTTAPASGFPSVSVAPGATVTLDVVFTSARVVFTALPEGTTTMLAAPGTTADCAGTGIRPVDPSAVTLLPGTWSFFVSGTTFDCSPGPAALVLASGDNGEQMWGQTTLRVTNAPAGTLWALNRSKVTGASPTSCPSPSFAGSAVNVDGARSAAVGLPAGDWFVYVTTGGAGDGCVGVPFNQYSKVLAYDTENTIAWTTAPSVVTVTGARAGAVSSPQNGSYSMVAWTGSTTMACANGVPSGTTRLTAQDTRYSGAFAAGSWRFFEVFTPTKGSPTCTFGGTVNVGSTGAPYSLPFSTTSPRTVS